MAMTIVHEGPIDRYVRQTGVTLEMFESRLRAGDAGAMALFGAESVFRGLSDLMVTIESSDRSEGGPRRRSPRN